MRACRIMEEDTALWKEARKQAKQKVDFYVHFAIYLVVNAFIFIQWWAIGGPGTFPWFLFPLGGWGIGVVAHFISAFTGGGFLATQTRREYERMREGHP